MPIVLDNYKLLAINLYGDSHAIDKSLAVNVRDDQGMWR